MGLGANPIRRPRQPTGQIVDVPPKIGHERAVFQLPVECLRVVAQLVPDLGKAIDPPVEQRTQSRADLVSIVQNIQAHADRRADDERPGDERTKKEPMAAPDNPVPTAAPINTPGISTDSLPSNYPNVALSRSR